MRYAIVFGVMVAAGACASDFEFRVEVSAVGAQTVVVIDGVEESPTQSVIVVEQSYESYEDALVATPVRLQIQIQSIPVYDRMLAPGLCEADARDWEREAIFIVVKEDAQPPTADLGYYKCDGPSGQIVGIP